VKNYRHLAVVLHLDQGHRDPAGAPRAQQCHLGPVRLELHRVEEYRHRLSMCLKSFVKLPSSICCDNRVNWS
jgi:hypothetical protein